MFKVYQSINSVFFATDILLADKKTVHIAFEGGTRYPKKVNGIYTTSNAEIQSAIEKDASFNVEFKLIRTEGIEENKAVDIQNANNDNQKDFPEVTKVGDARAILKNNFNEIAANRTEVFEIAERLGITFPNLSSE